MTVGRAAAAPAAHLEDHSERLLASRIIDTLLREGYGGLSGRVRVQDGDAVLDLPAGGWPGPPARRWSTTAFSPTSGCGGRRRACPRPG